MSYLVDTCTISELFKKQRCNPGVSKWFEETDEDEIFISVITLGEIRHGVELAMNKDKAKGRALAEWLNVIIEIYGDRSIPISAETADLWGRLGIHHPMSTQDGLIAASALLAKYTVVTRNVKDFERSGVPLFNPFTD